MKKANTFRLVLRASVRGAITILLVTMLGFAVGVYIETHIGRPVVSFELVPFNVWLVATMAGVPVAIAAALSGTWWRGLAIGLLVHGLVFGWLFFSMYTTPGYPFAVDCWAFAVGTIGGGAAGAMGGALRYH